MNSKDFTNSAPYDNSFNKESQDGRAIARPSDFTSQPLNSMVPFPQQPFAGNFMNMPPQNGMFYMPYPNQYMNYDYGYMSSPYKGGRNYYEKKGHHGYKKNYSPGSVKQQIFYAKKPKQPAKVEGEFLAEDFKKLSINDGGATDAANGTDEKPPSELKDAKFFVIKSYSEEDVHKAIKHNLWCSTRDGNLKLHDAFVTANNQYPIFLLFSVNASGHFVGLAQMKSPVDFEKNFPGWNQSHKWKGVFKISWLYIKDIPNREFRHLKNELNEGKPVPNSRDTQEVPFEVGQEVYKIFTNYKNQTSILDDFDYYEMKESK